MSTTTRLAQAREDLSAARAARAHAQSARDEARAMEAEQEIPQRRMQYAMHAVSARMAMNEADKDIARLTAEIAALEAERPVVLTAEQMAAVDDTAGLLP